MEVGHWITLGAVIVALGIGVASILHTQNLQKKERKERLLNEIIEWGLKVSILNSTSPFINYAEIKDFQRQRLMIALDVTNKFTTLEKRGKYIKQIASDIKDSLGDAVDLTIMNIKERNKLFAKSTGIKSAPPLDEIMKIHEILKENGETLDSLSADAKKLLALGQNSKTLEESVAKVIEEATKIQTRDIS